jgi:Tat protein translocase TatB subunit
VLLAFLFDSAGFGEWFVLLAVILVAVGPKNLPSAARKFGQWYARFRRHAEGFRRQLMELDQEMARGAADATREADEFFRIEGDEAAALPARTDIPDSPDGD